jgi:hypothetical protein
MSVPLATSISGDGKGNLWIVDGTLLRRFSGGRLATVTLPGVPAGANWGISDAANWPPADAPMNDAAAVAAHDGSVYVANTTELLRLGAGQRLETVAEFGDHVFGPLVATSSTVYLVDRFGNQVYVTHPAPPAATPPAAGSSTPWWLFAVIGAIALLLIVVVLGLRRGRRPARLSMK